MNTLLDIAKACGAKVIDTPEDRPVPVQVVFTTEQLEAFVSRVTPKLLGYAPMTPEFINLSALEAKDLAFRFNAQNPRTAPQFKVVAIYKVSEK